MSRYTAARRLSLSLGILLAGSGCALNARPALAPSKLAELWEQPVDLERRDLLHGAGGPEHAPNPNDSFEFLDIKTTGTNPGFDVKDAMGREWAVKLGVEARTEVVVSRVVWAVGYHQPFSYYVPQWTLVRDGKETVQPAGRFRLESSTHKKESEWSWRHNPFLGTRQLAGLFVLMVMFNNWDIKTAQNALYEVEDEDDGAEPRYWYVARDLGASLGKSGWLQLGTKDDLAGFEQEPFIKGVEGNRVRFAFQGGWAEPQLHTSVTPDDVRWICGLLARLSPKQWSDAFRAAGYSEAEAEPFIRRLKQKIEEGLKTGPL